MTIQTINDLQNAVQTGLEALRNAQLSPEAELARELLLPDGLTPVIELVQENLRKKRSSAAAWNWNPQVDRVLISFRPSGSSSNNPSGLPEEPTIEVKPDAFAQSASTPPPVSLQPASTAMHASEEIQSDNVMPQEIIECCQALAAAERSNRQFIALKWFRDDFLPTVDYSWAKSAQRRQRVLSQAIDIGRVDARKIHNPRAPLYPTTTINLNRTMPTPGVPPRFQPIAVRGEPVSTTLLRDRGSI